MPAIMNSGTVCMARSSFTASGTSITKGRAKVRPISPTKPAKTQAWLLSDDFLGGFRLSIDIKKEPLYWCGPFSVGTI